MDKVRTIMSGDPVTIHPDNSIREAASIINNHKTNAVAVVDMDNHLIGMFTEKHLIRAVSSGLDLDKTGVGEVMLTNVFSVKPEDLLRPLENKGISRAPVVDDEGKVVGMLTIAQFVRYYWDQFQKTANELDIIINSLYNPVVCIDQEGVIKLFNKSAEKLVDKPAAECIGRPVINVLPSSRLPDILQTGQVEFSQKIEIKGIQYFSNRSPIWQDGQIVGAVAVLQEISDLEAISMELEYTKRLNRELDAIIESSYDGLYVTDGNANTLRANKGFERITGVPADQHIGRNMADLVREGWYSRSGTLLAIERGEAVTLTQDVSTGKTTLITSNPIYDEDGNVTLVVTNVRDITELNELQRKLEHMEELSRHYQSELEQLKLQSSRDMIIRSPKMKEVVNLAVRVAGVDSTVIIEGESGVGKEKIAEIIRDNSDRRDKPFIKVNCGAIPDNLLESELFGYEAGAFTGAKKEGKPGLLELADEGIILLDEIGELPLPLQVKLLRFLQDKEITRVGGVKPMLVDVRVIAATNQDLNEMMERKEFREDLFYRLNVVPINIPPLRERKEEIPSLAAYFVQRFNRKYKRNVRLGYGVVDRLLDYHWPGNVRELENLMERLVVMTAGHTVSVEDLPPNLGGAQAKQGTGITISQVMPLKEAVESTEKQLLEKAFETYKSARKVAKELEVDPSTIVRKAAKYGIKPA
ncbi:MAG: sigma 54-interacting transcriptional regulator [Ignavibacteriales bacterium]